MNPRRYPKTKEAAVELAIDTIRREVPPDRAFDSCLEGGPEWNRHVAARIYRAALDDDALMRELPQYIDVEMARADFEVVFPMLAVGGA